MNMTPMLAGALLLVAAIGWPWSMPLLAYVARRTRSSSASWDLRY